MKTVSKIKFYEVLNWLFSNEEMPQRFIDARSQLNSIVPYIEEQFWAKPRVVRYLNRHTNYIFNIPDPIDKLELLRKVIKFQGLTKNDLYDYRSQFQPDILKEIEERENYDEGNARARLLMMRKKGIDTSVYIKKAPTKANIAQAVTSEDKRKVEEAIQYDKVIKKKLKEEAFLQDSRFLDDLNQDIIDSMELILFNVSLLKKANQVLLVFIDKDNQKKYYRMDFSAKFYISKKNGVINNDYIEQLTDEYFSYIITDHKLYTKLKFMLNNNYKRILNEN
jgi:hypothetical protein